MPAEGEEVVAAVFHAQDEDLVERLRGVVEAADGVWVFDLELQLRVDDLGGRQRVALLDVVGPLFGARVRVLVEGDGEPGWEGPSILVLFDGAVGEAEGR